MSRNAIFCFILFSTIYLLKTKKFYFLGLFYSFFVIVVLLIFNTDKNYHRDRFINSVNIFEKETIFSKKDDRFSRWSASFDVFLKKPVFGPGPVKVKELRREEYVKNLDSVAYNFNYNAHNQFLEYLSTYGLLGAMLFIGLIFKLYQLAFNKKAYFLIYLVSCFVISGITESVLYRSWGISLYILILISIVGFSNQEKWAPKLKTND
jgi:O-antigen ligase